MKTFKKAFYFPLLFLFLSTITFTSSAWGAFHSFDRINPDNTRNIQGNYAIGGNTVMCLTNHTTTYGGECHGMTDYELETSNRKISKYIDIDNDSGTWNSTSSYITVPSSFDYDTSNPANTKKGILWAGLFWQGRINGDDAYPLRFAQEDGAGGYTFTETGSGAGAGYTMPIDINTTGTDKIKLKVDTGSYTDISASTVYTYSSSGGTTYAAFSDVTNTVKTAISTDGNHTFTVANLTTCEGREGSPGVFGGWSIVVIYAEDNTGEMRNISVFNGFDSVNQNNPSFTISNFILPKTNTVNATLSLFSGEGEYRYGRRPGSNYSDWIKLSDDDSSFDYMPGAVHPNNIFDGVLTGVTRENITGESNNLQINNDGVDVDSYDVSALMTGYRDSNPNISTMYIRWFSNNDYITPSMLVFATQIYAPKLCYDYSLRQDGQFLERDASTPFPFINSYVSSSDLGISVYVRNMEADIPAKGVSIRSDVNTTKFTQTGPTWSSNTNGSILIDRGTPTTTTPLCDYNISMNNTTSDNGCTDGHNVRKGIGSLDAQDYVYSKFTLQPQVSAVTDINESLGLTLDYYIEVNGATIEYNDYVLGSENVPICTQSYSYEPAWGQFNVVRSGQTSVSNTNNIYTQISRNPFNASVIFDSDIATGTNEAPTSDVNTTLLVEIIDMDAYGDINASCANPDSSLTTAPIVVTTNFTNSDWKTDLTQQNPDYYNFAVKNAAYRVWYFTDNNGTLIENWTANTDTSKTNVTGISGLYDSAIHTACSTECSPSTSATCYNCIKNNYAKALCSRDNFSVRPESYDVRVYDVDQNNTVSDPSNIDLSTLKGFNPTSATTSNRIDLAADYNYRYDINATGHNGISYVPGYTRYFTNRNDYNVTLYWDPQSGQTGCNNTNDALIPFYIGNGTMQDEKRDHVQVGEYGLNITDTSWTAVDWLNTSHHTVADGFDNTGGVLTPDCQTNSTSTTAVGNKYGCTISTNHGTFNGFTYQDHDLTYHPYRFIVTNAITLGKGNIAPATGFKPFVYMSNLSNDENMSVHFNTTVTAVGKNSTTPLSNYVTGCYSKPLNFSIGKTATTNPVLRYNYIVHNKDINSSIISAHDINGIIAAGNVDLNATFSTNSIFFQKDQNGTIQLTTNLNYGRDVNVTTNPEDINFTTLFVDDNATLFNADLLANKTADGNVSVNQRVLHYYGKTMAPKIRVVCNTNICRTGMHASNNNNIKELIDYVVFCEGATCNSSILPIGATQIGDIRWFSNKNHDKIDNSGNWLTLGTDGDIGTISEVVSSGGINEITASRQIVIDKHETEAVIEHGATLPLPYDAIMQMQSSPWLIYNETDNNATANQFIIEFVGDGGWSGKYEDNTTTKTNFSPTTNRRIMW